MTKKTLLLHIGMGKTGTTALQEFFWDNRAALALLDVCYPEIGAQSAAHHLISPCRLQDLVDIGWVFLAPQEWIAQVQALPQSRILMSSELMFSADAEKVADFLAAVRAAFDVKIVVYLRRPDNAIMAAFNQQAKAGTQIRGIDAVLKARLPSFAYLDVLQRWEAGSAGGEGAMIVRPYERSQLKDGDIRADFLSHVLGIDSLDGFKQPIEAQNVNPRFSTMALEFKVLINNLIPDTTASAKFNAPLIDYSSSQDGGPQAVFKEQDTLTFSQRSEIIEYFREANSYVARHYMGRASGELFDDTLISGCDTPRDEGGIARGLAEIAQWIVTQAPELLAQMRDAIAAGLWADEPRIAQAARRLQAAFAQSSADGGLLLGVTPAPESRRAELRAKRRIILHPGFPEAGATTLQTAFFTQRAALLADFGVLYPGFDANHTKPVLAMFAADFSDKIRFRTMNADAISAYAQAARAAFEAELQGDDWRVLVISGEGIHYLKADEWSALTAYLSSWAACIDVQFSLRDPLDFARSAVQKLLQSGATLAAVYADPPRQNVRASVSRAMQGDVKIHFWNYTAAAVSGEGLVRSFLKGFDLPEDLVARLDAGGAVQEESLTAQGVAALAWRNAALRRAQPVGAAELAELLAIKGDPFEVPEDIAEAVRRSASDDAVWMREVFGA